MPIEAYAAIWAVAGGAVGALALPVLADALLKRKLAGMREWWRRAGGLWRDLRAADPSCAPDPSARGDEGAAGIWFEEVASAIRNGTLTKEQAEQARGFGVVVEDEPARTDADDDARFRFAPGAPGRAALALAMGAAMAGAALAPVPPAATALLSLAAVLVALCAVCDVRAHVIPIELCTALALCGLALRLVLFGAQGVAASVLAGIFVAVASAAAIAVFRTVAGRPRAIGAGDVRMMVALAMLCGPRASVLGAAACYGAALTASVALVAARKKRLSDAVPMAPFLALWAVVGVASSIAALSA